MLSDPRAAGNVTVAGPSILRPKHATLARMTRPRRIALFALLALFGTSLGGRAEAKLHAETIEYQDGDATLAGYLVYEEAGARRPGVVVVHDWMGLSAETKRRADLLAGLGYVALAADIYGKGVRPTDMQSAGAEAGKWKVNRASLRRRARAALDLLLQQKNVDPDHVAAIGYCFGGTTALELARSGAPIAGVVSFHGGLDSPTPADAKHIKGKVLVLHGADDPHVPAEQVLAFEKEMREGGVDWQLVAYGGAVHAFTIPAAGKDNAKGAAYNEKADRRSWEAMKLFFAELFGKR
jgi:dienelactone hydrolase